MSAGCLAQPMDQPGGGLPTQPFGDQPLVQPDPPGQLVGPDRLLRRVVSGQFAIEAEAITDVDGQGHHLAHLVAPHGEGKGLTASVSSPLRCSARESGGMGDVTAATVVEPFGPAATVRRCRVQDGIGPLSSRRDNVTTVKG